MEQKELTSANSPQALDDLKKLELLRNQLANIQKRAKYDTESRSIASRVAKSLEEYQETGETPKDSEMTYKLCLKWLEFNEAERQLHYVRELKKCKTMWPVASWSNRVEILRWVGRNSVRRHAFESPLYHLSRIGMQWALRELKRR